MVLTHEKLSKSAILNQFQSQLYGCTNWPSFYNSYNVMQHYRKNISAFWYQKMDSYCVMFQTIRYDNKINMLQLCALSVVTDKWMQCSLIPVETLYNISQNKWLIFSKISNHNHFPILQRTFFSEQNFDCSLAMKSCFFKVWMPEFSEFLRIF